MATAKLEPVTEIKRHATEIGDRVPVLITERGRSAAVLVDLDTWEAVQQRLTVLEGIARGERAIAEGRVVSQSAARRRMGKWLRARG